MAVVEDRLRGTTRCLPDFGHENTALPLPRPQPLAKCDLRRRSVTRTGQAVSRGPYGFYGAWGRWLGLGVLGTSEGADRPGRQQGAQFPRCSDCILAA